MTTSSSSKGKKRARDDTDNLNSYSTPSANKPKRAETKQCPICSEHIPLRLLAAHCELESERVEEIVRAVGSLDVIADSDDGAQFSRARRSATKARKAFGSTFTGSTDQALKIIKTVKRRRKQRHVKFREMIQDDELGAIEKFIGSTCPLCLSTIQGDPDVIEAHVDACLSHMARIQEEQAQIDLEGGDGPSVMRVTDGVDLSATGFHIRRQDQQDVEEDIDVDGNDEDTFGCAQFTEVDILSGTFGTNGGSEDNYVDADGIDTDDSQTTPQDSGFTRTSTGLVSISSSIKHIIEPSDSVPESLQVFIRKNSHPVDEAAVVQALKGRIEQLESERTTSTSSSCRICLEPYNEPTVSTQCWHTCCRECWLRCLATRLCPICKRITSAEHLRRIYL